jgi:hypothetical protein
MKQGKCWNSKKLASQAVCFPKPWDPTKISTLLANLRDIGVSNFGPGLLLPGTCDGEACAFLSLADRFALRL